MVKYFQNFANSNHRELNYSSKIFQKCNEWKSMQETIFKLKTFFYFCVSFIFIAPYQIGYMFSEYDNDDDADKDNDSQRRIVRIQWWQWQNLRPLVTSFAFVTWEYRSLTMNSVKL